MGARCSSSVCSRRYRTWMGCCTSCAKSGHYFCRPVRMPASSSLAPNPRPRSSPQAGPGVTVVGPVDDLRPHLSAAAVIAVPLRLGSGTRLKILEAWAMARPVVSTTLGAEGLGRRAGTTSAIADDPLGLRAVRCCVCWTSHSLLRNSAAKVVRWRSSAIRGRAPQRRLKPFSDKRWRGGTPRHSYTEGLRIESGIDWRGPDRSPASELPQNTPGSADCRSLRSFPGGRGEHR